MILTRFIYSTPHAPWNSKPNSLRSRSITPPTIKTHSNPETYEIKKNLISQFLGNITSYKKIISSLSNAASGRSLRPALYFAKGRKDNSPPISYLLTETQETPIPQNLPRKSSLLRTLCRGKGTLKQNSQGFVYLQIDEVFTDALFPVLEREYAVRKAPYFSLMSNPKGTHIPVISHKEHMFHHLEPIQEIGSEFSFEVIGFYAAKPTLWNEVEQVWFLQVESLELETLRSRYFLSSKLGGNPFHIAIAIQPTPSFSKAGLKPLMRINPAHLAA